MKFGSLFCGIGGFDLGLERAGMQCAWQVEIDPYAQKVLAKHWPDVRRHADVCTFPPEEGNWEVDVICGGFPCQDISYAGKGAGLAGARSGLWYEFARIIGQLRPRYVVVENVAALLTRGMGTVLGDLAALGYDAEWHVIPASAVGAPHRRERVWIVAHTVGARAWREGREVDEPRAWRASEALRQKNGTAGADWLEPASAAARDVPDSKRFGCQAESDGLQHSPATTDRKADFLGSFRQVPSDTNSAGRQQQLRPEPKPAQQLAFECSGWWESEPDVGRVAHGVPSRVDRLRCLGNAVVPQVVELIGRAIMDREAQTAARPREG
jgi:DNA (cytosine-5)-methyltransferase 1